MARDPREDCPFETLATLKPGEVAGLLWVPEAAIRGNFSLAPGTTLANALPGVSKGDALVRGFGSYVFTDNGPVQDGWHGFWFARPFEAWEITTPFRSVTELRGGIFWPAVMGGFSVYNFQAFDGDGVKYIADVIWDFNIRDSYDGPTKVLIEYFASHTPHSITTPTSMQPEGGTFYYGVAQVTLPKCLHQALELTYSTGQNNSRYPWQTFSKTFPATNLTEWPATITVDDGETFDNGLYIRRKVTGYRPGSSNNAPTVAAPTTASLGTTTVTLGGTVSTDGGATITERGVVYALTSANADPVIGGTGVTKTATSGTTGIFTVAVTGLTQGSAYTFKAYATNARGTVYTLLSTFTTVSTNANLSALTLSSGTLSPTFAAGTTSYTASVANGVSSITVTPTREQDNATIQVRVNAGSYTSVTSGTASGSLSLNVGSNTIDVLVTAQDGVTTKTYTSTVTRLAAPTVTSPTKTGITSTGATLGGNVTADGGATITQRGVVYAPTSTNNNPEIGGTGVLVDSASGTTGVFTVAVTGLTAATDYSFKAFATNSQGTTYTTVDTFTTL